MKTRTVKDVMSTALVTVKATNTIGVADAEMKLGAMRHLPVVDDDGKLVGILSARDVLRALVEGTKRIPVGPHMTTRVFAITEHTPLTHAIDLMLEHRIGALPVVNEHFQPVGIVTESDVLRVCRELLREEPS